jgi:hypothetical protein
MLGTGWEKFPEQKKKRGIEMRREILALVASVAVPTGLVIALPLSVALPTGSASAANPPAPGPSLVLT